MIEVTFIIKPNVMDFILTGNILKKQKINCIIYM